MNAAQVSPKNNIVTMLLKVKETYGNCKKYF